MDDPVDYGAQGAHDAQMAQHNAQDARQRTRNLEDRVASLEQRVNRPYWDWTITKGSRIAFKAANGEIVTGTVTHVEEGDSVITLTMSMWQ